MHLFEVVNIFDVFLFDKCQYFLVDEGVLGRLFLLKGPAPGRHQEPVLGFNAGGTTLPNDTYFPGSQKTTTVNSFTLLAITVTLVLHLVI